MEIFDLAPIPLYNADLEGNDPPTGVAEFKAKIAAADALLIAVPEYNHSIPGVLKNALDWASRPIQSQPFNGKPAAIMGVGGAMGTVRAQQHMRQIGVFLNLHFVQKPEVQIQFAREKFNPDGTLKDEKVREHVKALVEALAVWTRQLRGY